MAHGPYLHDEYLANIRHYPPPIGLRDGSQMCGFQDFQKITKTHIMCVFRYLPSLRGKFTFFGIFKKIQKNVHNVRFLKF